MKLRFKHQKFQADAARAVVDVFAGQPYLTPSYMMDRGNGYYQQALTDEEDFTGWSNHKIVPELNDRMILENLQKVQQANQLKPSDRLEDHYNLTIESVQPYCLRCRGQLPEPAESCDEVINLDFLDNTSQTKGRPLGLPLKLSYKCIPDHHPSDSTDIHPWCPLYEVYAHVYEAS